MVIIAAFVTYGVFAAYSVAHPLLTVGGPGLNVIVPMTIALAPFLIYLAAKYPLVFPFGIYALLGPFDQILSTSGSGGTITRLVAMLASGVLILNILLTREICLPARAWYLWAAFMGWSSLTMMWTLDPVYGQEVWKSEAQLFLVMTLLAIYRPKPREFGWMLSFIVLSGLLAVAYTFYQLAHGHAFSSDRLTIVADNGAAVDPNWLATSFLLPIAIGVMTMLSARSIPLRIICGLSVLPMVAGVFMTGSRGGLVALIISLAWLGWRSRHRLQMIAFTALAMTSSAFFPAVWTRFAKDPSEQGSGSGRTEIWRTGLHAISDHWFFGQGLGSFGRVYDRNILAVYQSSFEGWGRPSHSIIVGTVVELGVVGLTLVLLAWYSSFRQLRVIAPTSQRYSLRLAFEATLLGLFVQALFIDPYFIKYFWLALSLVFSLNNIESPRIVHPFERRRHLVTVLAAPSNVVT